ncbi:MAG: hypothetical protein R6X06_02005 [Gammaproteobacteria bacterium]
MMPMRAVNPLNEQAACYDMKSPLLFGVLQALDARVELLDLAPPNSNVLDYFSSYHCKLHLPACRDALLNLDATAEDQPPLTEVFRRYIPLAEGKPCSLDLLLLWDLPNYLDRSVLAALITYLMPYVSVGTVLHTYIHTRQRMPESPGNYRLTREHTVTVEMAATWRASSQLYYQELMNKVFAPFRVDRGMLLGNGLQEYLLHLK